MMTLPKYAQTEPHTNHHTCSVCTRRGEWTASWRWYGSLDDLDAGKPVIKACSDRCKAKAEEGEGNCPHRMPPKLSYIGGQTDASRRLELGEGQYQCPVCKLWVWGEYWEDGTPEDDD